MKSIKILSVLLFTIFFANSFAQSQNTTYLGSAFVPGRAFDIALSNRYAYSVSWHSGSSLNILDLLNPSNPSLVSSLNMQDAYGVTIQSDYAFIADGIAGLKIVNISNPYSPYMVGEINTPGTARDVKIYGNYALVADQSAGLRVIDISTLSEPIEVGFLNTPGRTFDIEIRDQYAFLADAEGGLRIIDISTITNPVEVNVYETQDKVVDIEFKDNLALFTDGYQGLKVVDISDPLNISPIGSFSSPYWFLGLKVEGDYAYVAAWEGGLRVIDIMDPANPSEVGYYVTTGKSRDLFVRGNYIYIADWDPGIQIVRNDLLLPNPNTTPLSSASVTGRSFDVTVENSIAYIANWSTPTLEIVNVEDVSNPFHLGSYATSDSYGITVDGNYAFLADGIAGLKIFDISQPNNITLVGQINTPGTSRDVKIYNNYALVADQSAGLRVIDISTLSEPIEVGFLNTPGRTFDIEIRNQYAFLADAEGGLRIIDINSPTNPVEVNVYETEGNVVDIEFKDNLAFFTDGFEGLKAIDITDPLNIIRVGEFSSPFWFLGLKIEGDYAYVASWEYGGLRIIDITDISEMKEVGYYITPGNCRDLDVVNGILFIADWDYGLRIINNNLVNPIPVELVSFTAAQSDEQIHLTWITATELNNQGFEIERKAANNWEKIGFVDGYGTTTEMQYYSFTDNIGLVSNAGIIFYRLKQIDFDGTYEYSNEVTITISQPNSYLLNQNYPNPFNPSTIISFQLAESKFVTLKVYDVLGNEVELLVNEEKPAGKFEIEFNFVNLSSGIYYYKLVAGDFVDVKKMILLK